jgi:hypothetical protein
VRTFPDRDAQLFFGADEIPLVNCCGIMSASDAET